VRTPGIEGYSRDVGVRVGLWWCGVGVGGRFAWRGRVVQGECRCWWCVVVLLGLRVARWGGVCREVRDWLWPCREVVGRRRMGIQGVTL